MIRRSSTADHVLSVTRPSSAVTPERGWVASLFPTLSRFNEADWAVVAAAQALFYKALSLLAPDENPPDTGNNRTVKDVGTLIVDNQDFEQRILSGNV